VFVTIGTTLVRAAFAILLGYVAGWRPFGRSERKSSARLILDWLLPPLLFLGRAKKPAAELPAYNIALIFPAGLMVLYLPVLFAYFFPLPLKPDHGNHKSKSLGPSGHGLHGHSHPWPPVWSCKAFSDAGHESRSYA
jgi:hypothetical protein